MLRPDNNRFSQYEDHEGGEGNDDLGDMPLLRRDSSTGGGPAPFPGGFTDNAGDYVGDRHTAEGDDDDNTNIRYGNIPLRVPRRYKTMKRVELFHGNLVFDSPVPQKLLDRCVHRNEREFTHMRYSAATCDPNDFMKEGFTLRQVLYEPPRRTELFIVMTMYNEDDELFCRTFHGVMKNIAHLCSRTRSRTWGNDGWKKVVVCIVSDGRKKIHPRTLSVIAALGAYQDGVAKNVVNKKPVVVHIYEYTTQSTSSHICSHILTLHFRQKKSPSLPIRRSKAPRRAWFPSRSSFASKKTIKRRSIPTAGFLTPSAPFSCQTYVSSLMSARSPVPLPSTISGKLSISTRTSVGRAERSSL